MYNPERFSACFALILLSGCALRRPNTPTKAGIHPADLIDPAAEESKASYSQQIYQVSEQIRRQQAPALLPPKRTVLCLSGGGVYGSHTAGVLVGWSEMGTRPKFDVVTGVSTGALIATLAYLGPEYDCELKRVYTTLKPHDIYRRRATVLALTTNSLADNSPLLRRIEEVATPTLLERVAQEHETGRKLYVATTDLDSRRTVIWDLGAIACRRTPEARELFCKILLASAAIPGFFPPVEIPCNVDGVAYVERHVDGGVTTPLFYRPPYIAPERRFLPPAENFYGSDVYAIVAGKLYADPRPARNGIIPIAGSSVSSLLYAQTRSELVNLYHTSVIAGMNYRQASIRLDFPVPPTSTDFDPKEMSRMFEEGVAQVKSGNVWRSSPPGVDSGEEPQLRAGVDLKLVPGASPMTPLSDPVIVLPLPVNPALEVGPPAVVK